MATLGDSLLCALRRWKESSLRGNVSLLIVMISITLVLMAVSLLHIGQSPLWEPEEKQRLLTFSLTKYLARYDGRPPPSFSNAVADLPAAAALGRALFFDVRFSRNGKVACASCHQPTKNYTDGLPVSQAIGQTHRNAPTLMGSAWQRWLYWDGRKDSLWSQALSPLEAFNEMGGNRLDIVRQLLSDQHYRREYESIFGRVPSILQSLTDEAASSFDMPWPEAASPLGNKTEKQHWRRLTANQRHAVNRVFSNIGKVIEAFERGLNPEPSRFDQLVDAIALGRSFRSDFNDNEIQGLHLFLDVDKTGCLNCHNGPLLTNRGFHNIGTGRLNTPPLDFGRALGLQALSIDPFNCLGNFSDARPSQCLSMRFVKRTHQETMVGAFKVPSLRGVSKTAPYFHDGRFNTLKDVLNFYRSPPASQGQELQELTLTNHEADALLAFLKTL